MARRLCLDERARIDAMAQLGLGAGETARRLGRHRSTVQRELALVSGGREPPLYVVEWSRRGSLGAGCSPRRVGL